MISLKLGSTIYLNYPKDDISILRDIYGYETAPRDLSLLEKAKFLKRYVQARKEIIELWLKLHKTDGIKDFNDKKSPDYSFRTIAAGLIAIKDKEMLSERFVNSPVDPLNSIDAPYSNMPNEDFPIEINSWIKSQVIKNRKIGTGAGLPLKDDHKYDFWLAEMVPLLYIFETDSKLLEDDACVAIVENGILPLMGQNLALTYPVKVEWWVYGLTGFIAIAALVNIFTASVGITAAALFVSLLVAGSLKYPETENHVLLGHSSIYLANQWVNTNPRGIEAFEDSKYTDKDLENKDGPLEDLLLQATGRIVHNDFFETNARAYQSHSMQALFMLRSFAASPSVVTGSQNALDFAILKFASQSLKSQRIVPFRRSWKAGNDVSLYDNVAKVMGALTTERLWPDSEWGDGNSSGFALWACLMNYRVPDLLLDYVKRDKEPNKQASGYWTQAQARFSGEHYKEGQAPRYFNDNGSNFMDQESFKVTPELCFITPDFINTWGGRFSRYPMRFDGIWATFSQENSNGAREYDRLTRLSTVLGSREYLKWSTNREDMDNRTMFQYPGKDFWIKTRSSCYKSVVYAVTPGDDSPINIPWHRHSESGVSNFKRGAATFSFYDLTGADNSNPNWQIFVVSARFVKHRGHARAIWEIVPAARFSSISQLITNVLVENNEDNFPEGSSLFFFNMTTGERLQLDNRFPDNDRTGISKITLTDGTVINSDEAVIDDAPFRAPLILVREVNEEFHFTGRTFARSAGDGVIMITNHFANYELTLDSRNYSNPKRTGAILS